MSDEKRYSDKASCGFNEYKDTARDSARVPTGWVWVYVGPVAGAPKPPVTAPAPKPLTKDRLKTLRDDAKKKARAKAQGEIDSIKARGFPSRCRQMVGFDSDFFDEPYSVGEPRALLDWFDNTFLLGTIPSVIRIRWQIWVQDAAQDYHLHFQCTKPEVIEG